MRPDYLALFAKCFGLALLIVFMLSVPQSSNAHRMGKDASVIEGERFAVTNIMAFPKWGGVVHRAWARRPEAEGLCARRMGRECQLLEWQAFLAGLQDTQAAQRLEQVNRYINRTRYRSDERNWGQIDYWAAPGEFFARGGDCEDYAIAKYFSLQALGFSGDAMRIVILKDTRRRETHAVLEVTLGQEKVLLDNLNDRLVSWDEVDHYAPFYSVNELSYWLHSAKGDI